MKLVPITILIFFPLWMLSQELNIDPINETLTLDKEKTIEIAKIVKNEARLGAKIDSLRGQILTLSDSLQILEQEYSEQADRLSELVFQSREQQEKIQELTERDLQIEKKKRPYGLYGGIRVVGSREDLSFVGPDLTVVTRKFLISAGIDPWSLSSPVLTVGIGFRIF